jgi:hypothetical protein
MIEILKGFKTFNLSFEPITASDVQSIYDLRINRKNNYLNSIDNSIDAQYVYFEKYLSRYNLGLEVYFKITSSKTGEIFGFVRFTHLKEDLFLGWESLILKSGSPAPVGIQVCFLAYYISFEILDRSLLGPWFVSNDNLHMMKIHEYMNLIAIVRSDERGSALIVSKNDYEAKKNKFLKWGFADGFSINKE